MYLLFNNSNGTYSVMVDMVCVCTMTSLEKAFGVFVAAYYVFDIVVCKHVAKSVAFWCKFGFKMNDESGTITCRSCVALAEKLALTPPTSARKPGAKHKLKAGGNGNSVTGDSGVGVTGSTGNRVTAGSGNAVTGNSSLVSVTCSSGSGRTGDTGFSVTGDCLNCVTAGSGNGVTDSSVDVSDGSVISLNGESGNGVTGVSEVAVASSSGVSVETVLKENNFRSRKKGVCKQKLNAGSENECLKLSFSASKRPCRSKKKINDFYFY